MSKTLTPKALAARVLARQKFLEEVLPFVTSLVSNKGKVLSHVVHSCHTQTKAALDNFAGFSFYTYGSFTMYGGEEAKIWYHAGSNEKPAQPVLEVQWWDIKECEVKHFDPSAKWQRAIKVLVRDKERVERIAKVAEKKLKVDEERGLHAAERDRQLQIAEANLKKDMERLGFPA